MLRALDLLRTELGFGLELRDVDTDPALEARFGELVPLLADANGREICHYFLDETALRQRLAVK